MRTKFKSTLSLLLAVLLSLSFMVPAFADTAKTVEEKPTPEVTFYFVRHGETIFNAEGRAQGWSDAPLTDKGIDSAKTLGKGLASGGISFQKVYSSDSGRAVNTARNMVDTLGLKGIAINEDWRLRECYFGSLDGLPIPDVLAQIVSANKLKSGEEVLALPWPAFFDAYAKADPKGLGDDWESLSTRLTGALNDINTEMLKAGGGNVLIVSHGYAINAMIETIDPSKNIPINTIKNSSVTIVKYKNGEFSVESVNDTSYFDKVAAK